MKLAKDALLAAICIATAFTNSAYGQTGNKPSAGGYTITARVENGNTYNSIISEVRSIVDEGSFFQLPKQVSGAYVNGGFTVTLPGALDAKSLEDMSGLFGSEDISDKSAKYFVCPGLAGYDHSGIHIGNFAQYDGSSVKIGKYDDGEGGEHRELEGWEHGVSFWYVDRDVTVNSLGDGESNPSNLVLKKGWNKVYVSSHSLTGNGNQTTTKPDDVNVKWQLRRDNYYDAAFKTRFAKGALGASGKSRPIEMLFENVDNMGGNLIAIGGKSKTNVAEDAFSGELTIKNQTVGGSCKSGEFEVKGDYDLREEKSKTSGSFTGNFTACEKNGKLTKASFEGNWVKHATGNKTPCNFGL
jgi:hypothetical protein